MHLPRRWLGATGGTRVCRFESSSASACQSAAVDQSDRADGRGRWSERGRREEAQKHAKLPISKLGTPARDCRSAAGTCSCAARGSRPQPKTHAKRSQPERDPANAEPRRASPSLGAPPEARHGLGGLLGGSARLTGAQEARSSASPVRKTSPLLAKKWIAFQCLRRSRCPGAHCCPSSSASMRAAHSFQFSSRMAWRRQPPWHCAGARGATASRGGAGASPSGCELDFESACSNAPPCAVYFSRII